MSPEYMSLKSLARNELRVADVAWVCLCLFHDNTIATSLSALSAVLVHRILGLKELGALLAAERAHSPIPLGHQVLLLDPVSEVYVMRPFLELVDLPFETVDGLLHLLQLAVLS